MFAIVSGIGVLLFPLVIYFSFISNSIILKPYLSNRKIKYLIFALLLIQAAGPFLYFHFSRVLYSPILIDLGAYLMGALILLFFASLFFYVIRFLSWISKQKYRRQLEIIFFTFTIIYFIGSFIVGAMFPTVRTEQISIKNFPVSGYKILHLSDVHLGPFLREEFASRLVSKVIELNPDILIISGDFNDSDPEHIKETLSPFEKLTMSDGIFLSLGNHEFYHDPIGITNRVSELGMKMLLNEKVEIQKEGGSFYVMGISDPVGNNFGLFAPDYITPFKEVSSNIPIILTAHRPSMITKLPQEVDLMLSGHTHGGQIFPFGFMVSLVEPYLYGLHKISDRMWLNVSRGTGFWGPPIRFPHSSEIVLININSK